MKKFLYIIILILGLGNHIQAANYSGSIQAGELATSIDNPSSITQLTLSGTMDVRDFVFIADSLRQLTLLDLSDCTISTWGSRDNYLGIESQFESNTIPAHSFLGMEELTTIKLPANTIKIGDGAFAGCTQLVAIEWGEHLQEIGNYSFTGCTSLNTTLPTTLTSIGEYAFETCTALTSIALAQTQVSTIGNHAFANCTSSTAITLPETLKSLANNVFAGCIGIGEITLPASITQMGSSCFAHCSNLTSVNMKECKQLTTVAPYTFDHCSKLQNLDLPTSIAEIGEGAFYYCQSLTTCILPTSLQHIDDYAFAKTAIAELNFLPQGIETIGRWNFYRLESLQTATLPSSLTFIGDHAFDHCSVINSVYCEAVTPPTLGENVFQDVPQASCLLYVPEESISLYKGAEQWNQFTIYIPNSTEEIIADENIKAFFIGYELTIQSQVPLQNISLYTGDGRLIYKQTEVNTHFSIDTQAYSGGIFILSIQKESGEYTHLKLGRSH